MIPKQKLYMLISIFFLTVAMVIFIFNGIIIPGKIDEYAAEISYSLTKIKSTGYYVVPELLPKGAFIDLTNFDDHFVKTDVFSEKNIRHITSDLIEKGFYVKEEMHQGEIITRSDILDDISEYNSRLYEVIINNSFCGQLRPGEIVDLLALNGTKIKVLVEERQIKGVYGYSAGKYIQADKIQTDSEAVLFVELTEREYELLLENEVVYARKLGDLYGY